MTPLEMLWKAIHRWTVNRGRKPTPQWCRWKSVPLKNYTQYKMQRTIMLPLTFSCQNTQCIAVCGAVRPRTSQSAGVDSGTHWKVHAMCFLTHTSRGRLGPRASFTWGGDKPGIHVNLTSLYNNIVAEQVHAVTAKSIPWRLWPISAG